MNNEDQPWITDALFNRIIEIKMTKYRRMIFAKRHESHLMYLIRLYWHGAKDYVFGAIAGFFIVWFIFYSVDAHADAKQSKLTLSCVAINVFHEAAHEPDLGKFAVAFVTMNRMRISNEDACTVVFKSKQFSWANHAIDSTGKLKPEYMPKGSKWIDAKRIAVMALSGDVEDFTNGADHYHADYISKPKWTRNMAYVGKWGSHLFYRGVM